MIEDYGNNEVLNTYIQPLLKAERERAIREVAEHVRYLMLCPVSGTKEPSEVEASILKLLDN
jgi:hypothetical protein